MRYYKFSAAERKLTLAEAERSEPGPGQIRVKVAAASLNYRDPYMISRFREVGIDNRIPLSDASGTVDAVGDGAMRFQPGDRVATIFFPDWISGRFRSSYALSALGGERADGVLSEYVIVPERALVASPPFLSDVEIAALPCAAVTAWHALFVRAPLERRGQVASRCLHCNSHTPPAFAASSCHRPMTNLNELESSGHLISSIIETRQTGIWRSRKSPKEKAPHTFWRLAARTRTNDPCNASQPTAPLRR